MTRLDQIAAHAEAHDFALMPFGLRYESIGIAKGSTNDPDRNRPSASGG